MSYFNQPDHEQLDRRDRDARELLLRLARGRLIGLEVPTPRQPIHSASVAVGADITSAWRAYALQLALPAPDAIPLVIDEDVVALVWRDHYVAALFAVNGELAGKLDNKGFEVVMLGETEASWAEPTSYLAKLLGRSM
jgi:hypothetical protein